jgi:hypothetical protein
MGLPEEMGRSAARMVDDTTTHFTLSQIFPKSPVRPGQPAVIQAVIPIRGSGRGKLRVSGHSTSQHFVGPHTCETRRAVRRARAPFCIVGDAGDQSCVGTLIAAHRMTAAL